MASLIFSTTLALAYKATTQHCHHTSRSSTFIPALASLSPAPPSSTLVICTFCGIHNHQQAYCNRFLKAQLEQAQQEVKAAFPAPTIQEYAGNASALSAEDAPSTEPLCQLVGKHRSH
ncbi:hypothetical protein CPC08DRAFT_771850 [Agrocybe pediades]|nr:hypothetical protein CPC08DRAFT_771850 [Agrocybe pediades]